MKNYLTIILLISTLLYCNKKSEDQSALLALLGAGSSAGSNSASSYPTDPSKLQANLSNAKAVGVSKNQITSKALTRSEETNTTNAVVINKDDTITTAFNTGNVKIKKFYILKNKGVLAELSSDISIAEENGESFVRSTGKTKANDTKNYQACKVLISDDKGKVKCLDKDINIFEERELISNISFDNSGNIFTVARDRDNAVRVKKFKVDGSNKEVIYTQGNGTLSSVRVTDVGEVLVNHYSSNTAITKFDSIKDGVTTTVDSNSTGTSYYFVEKFPDNKFYFSHNIGGANGTGIFYYDPNTTTITNWSSSINAGSPGNWDNWTSQYSGTNFCSAGNGFLVRNNSQVYYKALPQFAGSVHYKLYKIYSRLQVVHITGIEDVVAIYSVEDSEEILVAGKPTGSSLITFRLVNTNTLASRATTLNGLSSLPENVSVNQDKKIIEIIESKTIKTFDFSTGTATYTEKTINLELTQIKSI